MAKHFSLDDLSVISTPQNINKIDLRDINTLLSLETAKRSKEHEDNLLSQAEEACRSYQEAQAEYRHFYELYVRLYENDAIRSMLLSHSNVSKDLLDQFELSKQIIDRNIKNEEAAGYFASDVVEHLQNAIRQIKVHDEIGKIRDETVKMKNAVEAMQMLNPSIEQQLESVINRTVDFHFEQLQDKLN